MPGTVPRGPAPLCLRAGEARAWGHPRAQGRRPSTRAAPHLAHVGGNDAFVSAGRRGGSTRAPQRRLRLRRAFGVASTPCGATTPSSLSGPAVASTPCAATTKCVARGAFRAVHPLSAFGPRGLSLGAPAAVRRGDGLRATLRSGYRTTSLLRTFSPLIGLPGIAALRGTYS